MSGKIRWDLDKRRPRPDSINADKDFCAKASFESREAENAETRRMIGEIRVDPQLDKLEKKELAIARMNRIIEVLDRNPRAALLSSEVDFVERLRRLMHFLARGGVLEPADPAKLEARRLDKERRWALGQHAKRERVAKIPAELRDPKLLPKKPPGRP